MASTALARVDGGSADGGHGKASTTTSHVNVDAATRTCGAEEVSRALRDLFPPASFPARKAAAEWLSACGTADIEGPVGAALALAQNESTQTPAARDGALAFVRVLERIASPFAEAALARSVRAPGAVEVRAAEARALARRDRADATADVLSDVRENDDLRAALLEAIDESGHPPPMPYLRWLATHGGPKVSTRAKDIARRLTAQRPTAPPSRTIAATPAASDEVTAPGASSPPSSSPPSLSPPSLSPKSGPPQSLSPQIPRSLSSAPPSPPGPRDGRPLAMGAAAVAGSALMVNLSLLGVQTPTTQLLLGGAGGVIGFGTARGLSRFGLRPTLEEAAWFTNVTAWGTLAGYAMFGGSGSDNYRLRYGSLVLGEAAGMAAGVWSARRWRWSAGQIVLADAIVMGAGLTAFGIERVLSDVPSIGPGHAVAVVPVMVAAALVGHTLAPTRNDLALMMTTALGGAWAGGLLVAGAAEEPLFASRAGQGGAAAGLGIGYLAGVAASAFTDVDPKRLWAAAGGFAAGSVFGLGSHMLATGLARASTGLAPGDTEGFKLGAGLGALATGALAFAIEPWIAPGLRAPEMAVWGASYAAGTYALALHAAFGDSTLNDAQRTAWRGGLLATGAAGGAAGLVLSRWFAPDPRAQVTTLGAVLAATAAGWGTAAVLAPQRGAADAAGVAFGSSAGLALGAWFTHRARLREPSLFAAGAGLGYGGVLGALAASLDDQTWVADRSIEGALMLGAGAGALGSAAIANATDASPGQVAVPSVAVGLGLAVGTGFGSVANPDGSHAARIGALSGAAASGAASLILDRRLHLSDGLGPAAARLTLMTTAFGIAEGALLAGAVDDSGRVAGANGTRLGGGMLALGSAGLAGGLVLSRTWAPPARDLAFAASTSALAGWGAYGFAELVTADVGRAPTTAAMVGAAAGLVGGALASPHVTLTTPITTGAMTGGALGLLVGTLAPSLRAEIFRFDPQSAGGGKLGLALGTFGGVAAAKGFGATPRESAAVAIASALGLGVGVGAGGLLSRGGTETTAGDLPDQQPERIGAVMGPSAAALATMLLARPLRLAEPLPEHAPLVAFYLGATGAAEGVLLAAAIDGSGSIGATSYHHRRAGLLLGGSLGVAAGLIAAPRIVLERGDLKLIATTQLALASIGRGLALSLIDRPGRADAIGPLAGSLVGLGGGVLVASHLEAAPADGGAVAVGAISGALVGSLLPTLTVDNWSGFDRHATGGMWLGAGSGALAGLAVRHATAASGRAVALTALAGAGGAVTGLGWGMLWRTHTRGGDADADAVADANGAGFTRPLRVGVAAGAVAGLGLGMATWPRLTLDDDAADPRASNDVPFVASATALAGWNALWLPTLGHADAADFDREQMSAALLAGAGTASFASVLAAPALHVDSDLIVNALALDAIWSGAGAGVGALVSERADAPVAGLLIGGAGGLVLGGALHRRIELTRGRAPLLALGIGEGLWTGLWLPHLLRPADQVTLEQQQGALAAGAFGGLGIALLAGAAFTPEAADVGFATFGSGVGAALGGGLALASDDIEGQAAAALTAGGSLAGLATAGWLVPRLEIDSAPLAAAAVGGALGVGEATLFAWSGRATRSDAYTGAALLGAGLGSTLGLAAGARVDSSRSETPAAAGFAAWGAWSGAFAGSLVARDAHEITLGGLLGANVGFLAGWGLLHSDFVDVGDFGWLSLFAAAGTVAGAAATSPFSSRTDPTPVLAGLAVGPVAGMLAGALALPRIHRWRKPTPLPPSSVSVVPPQRFANYALGRRARSEPAAASLPTGPGGPAERPIEASLAHEPGSPEVLSDVEERSKSRRRLGRAVAATVKLSDCAPLVGALPATENTGGPPPVLIGLTGRWH